MDDADEFFDCDNEDYSAPVNDSLFDGIVDGIAGTLTYSVNVMSVMTYSATQMKVSTSVSACTDTLS